MTDDEFLMQVIVEANARGMGGIVDAVIAHMRRDAEKALVSLGAIATEATE